MPLTHTQNVCVCGGSTESSQKAKHNLKQQIPHKCWEQQVDTDW